MKQVEEEYYKSDDKLAQQPHANIAHTNDLYPPSPDQPIPTHPQDIPEPVQEAVSSLIRSQKTLENVLIIPNDYEVIKKTDLQDVKPIE